jgi:hypothetical protein
MPCIKHKSTCVNSGKYCSTALLQSKPDFLKRKGWLQEEIEATRHDISYYPKFHCELNFIEQF